MDPTAINSAPVILVQYALALDPVRGTYRVMVSAAAHLTDRATTASIQTQSIATRMVRCSSTAPVCATPVLRERPAISVSRTTMDPSAFIAWPPPPATTTALVRRRGIVSVRSSTVAPPASSASRTTTTTRLAFTARRAAPAPDVVAATAMAIAFAPRPSTARHADSVFRGMEVLPAMRVPQRRLGSAICTAPAVRARLAQAHARATQAGWGRRVSIPTTARVRITARHRATAPACVTSGLRVCRARNAPSTTMHTPCANFAQPALAALGMGPVIPRVPACAMWVSPDQTAPSVPLTTTNILLAHIA